MARISVDNDSWKAGGIIHRDNRHTAVDDTPRKWPAKKDTKKWCRGRVGRPHTVQTRDCWYADSWWTRQYLEDYCTRCDKVLKFYLK